MRRQIIELNCIGYDGRRRLCGARRDHAALAVLNAPAARWGHRARNGLHRGAQLVKGQVWQQLVNDHLLQVLRGIKNLLAMPTAHPPIGDAELVRNDLEQGRAGRAAGSLAHRLWIVGALISSLSPLNVFTICARLRSQVRLHAKRS